MVTLAVPPPAALGRTFASTAQLKRSWYIYFFQTRGAEAMVARGDHELLATLWQDWSPGYDATEDLEALLHALDSPERVAAAVGYYRAMYDRSRRDPDLAPLAGRLGDPQLIPTLYLHGQDDGCLGPEGIATALESLPAGSRTQLISGAGHFLQLEEPELVAAAILDFLGPARG